MNTNGNTNEQQEILRKFKDQTVVRQLRQISRYMYQEIDRRMSLRGHTGLSARHFQVFENIDFEGTNITKLAQRSGITKQAMSKLVQEISEQGYIDVKNRPEDFRAYAVTFTDKGFKFLEEAREEVIKTRAAISELISAEEYQQFSSTLVKLLTYLEETHGRM